MKSIAYLGLIVAIAACGESEDSKNDVPSFDPILTAAIKSIDITDATHLFVAGAGDDSASLTDSERLFKVTEDGAVIQVSYIKEGSDEVFTDIVAPSHIFQPLPDYLIFGFNKVSESYLVRKSDGAAFLFGYEDESDPANSIGFAFTPKSKFYGNENGIYHASNGGVYKIDISDPENLRLEEISAVSDNVDDTTWAVDTDGNLIYATGYDYEGQERLRLADGTFKNVDVTSFWLGTEGTLLGIKRPIKDLDEYQVIDVVADSVLYDTADNKKMECGSADSDSNFEEFRLRDDTLDLDASTLICVVPPSAPSTTCQGISNRVVSSGQKFSDLVATLNEQSGLEAKYVGDTIYVTKISSLYEDFDGATHVMPAEFGPCNVRSVSLPAITNAFRDDHRIVEFKEAEMFIYDESIDSVIEVKLTEDTGYKSEDDYDVKNVKSSEDSYFVYGNSALWKINKDTFAIENITPSEIIDIVEFDVEPNGNVFLSGPTPDGSYSVGALGEDGYRESDKIESQVRLLKRVN